jgi:hypothetical protein
MKDCKECSYMGVWSLKRNLLWIDAHVHPPWRENCVRAISHGASLFRNTILLSLHTIVRKWGFTFSVDRPNMTWFYAMECVCFKNELDLLPTWDICVSLSWIQPEMPWFLQLPTKIMGKKIHYNYSMLLLCGALGWTRLTDPL